MAEGAAAGAAENTKSGPVLTPERVSEELQRVSAEIGDDLREYENRYPNPTERILSRVMTE